MNIEERSLVASRATIGMTAFKGKTAKYTPQIAG